MEKIYKNIKKAKALLMKQYGMSPADAEDCVADALLYFVKMDYISRYDEKKADLFTYFFNLVKHYAIKYTKKTKTQELEDIDIDIEDVSEDSEYSVERLNKIIPLLNIKENARCKNVNGRNYDKWYLYIIDSLNGLSMKEIAEKEGVSVETIKSRIHKTRRRIIEVYSDYYGIKKIEYSKGSKPGTKNYYIKKKNKK